MSFGLTNTLTTHRLNESSFSTFIDWFVIMVIDDILLYSYSKHEHKQHLLTILQTFREHQLYVKFSKYEF